MKAEVSWEIRQISLLFNSLLRFNCAKCKTQLNSKTVAAYVQKTYPFNYTELEPICKRCDN